MEDKNSDFGVALFCFAVIVSVSVLIGFGTNWKVGWGIFVLSFLFTELLLKITEETGEINKRLKILCKDKDKEPLIKVAER